MVILQTWIVWFCDLGSFSLSCVSLERTSHLFTFTEKLSEQKLSSPPVKDTTGILGVLYIRMVYLQFDVQWH